MLRTLLLVVLMSLIVLSGAPESTQVGAQPDVITAEGSFELDPFSGGAIDANEITLRFPAGGGDVTGDWTTAATVDFGGEAYVCVVAATMSGPLEGKYDGGSVLSGTTVATSSSSVVTGCEEGGPIGSGSAALSWSATFVDGQVTGDLDMEDPEAGPPMRFTATVLTTGETDGEVGPGTGQDAEDSPDLPPDFADVFFGTEGIEVLAPRVAERLDCTGAGADPSLDLLPCRQLQPALADLIRFTQLFKTNFPNPSEFERRLGAVLGDAVFLAGIEDKDGEPLFPSVRAATPLIEKLADLRTTYAVPGQDAVTVVERFVQLLAGRDAAAWEERSP